MKTLKAALVIICTALAATAAHAETELMQNWREGATTWRGLVGASRSAVDVGIDYERRMGTVGIGGFFLYSAENDSTEISEKPEQMVLGLNTPIHLIDRSPFDVYIAPGINVTTHKEFEASDDETTFGPLLRIGAIYSFNKSWGVGFDYLTATNWTNDDVAQEYNYVNLAVAYTM